MSNTKKRHLEILEAAKTVLKENDIDITRPLGDERPRLAREVMTITGCGITAAKNNLAKAFRIARGQPLRSRWGGDRKSEGWRESE